MLKKKKREIEMDFDLTTPAIKPVQKPQPKKKLAHEIEKKYDPLEIEDEFAPKKKKKAGTALTIGSIDRVRPKSEKAAKPSLATMQSIFKEDAQELVGLMEDGDEDSTLSRLNKRLIQSSINLIAQVEKGIHDSNGRYGVHGYTGLVQTIRELVIDLQNTKDRGAMGLTIAENIMRPAFLDMATSVMTEYASVANDLKDLVDPVVYAEFRKSQIDSRNRLATLMQEQYMKMRDETINFLQR